MQRTSRDAFRGWVNRRIGYLFLAPTALALALVIFLPILFSVAMAFFRFDLLRANLGNPFYGVTHFVDSLTDALFWNALSNTLVWTFGNIVLQLLAGLGLALLLNRKIKLKIIYYVVILLPWATPSAVAALIWRWLLHAEFGVVNAVGQRLGVIAAPIAWLSTSGWAMFWVILAKAWKEYAINVVIFTAALQTIPVSVYEAAEIDGAGAVVRFFRINLPWLRSSIMIATVLIAIGCFNGFNMIWMMTKGGPVRETEILSTFIYQTAFSGYQLGRASAQSILMVLVLSVMVVFYIRRTDTEGVV